jgi:hypothetical protein
MLFYTFLVVTFKKISKKCISPLKFLNFLAPGYGSGIRIPNTDPEPQSHWIRIQSGLGYGSGSTTLINWETGLQCTKSGSCSLVWLPQLPVPRYHLFFNQQVLSRTKLDALFRLEFTRTTEVFFLSYRKWWRYNYSENNCLLEKQYLDVSTSTAVTHWTFDLIRHWIPIWTRKMPTKQHKEKSLT